MDVPKVIPPPALSASRETWALYREAANLFYGGKTALEIAEATGFDLATIESWIYHIWCREKRTTALKEVNRQVTLNKEKVLSVINTTLDIVRSQVDYYRKASDDGAMFKVSEVRALTETVRNLYDLISTQISQEELAAKTTNVTGDITIKGVKDVVRLLKRVDPDIDYERLIDEK